MTIGSLALVLLACIIAVTAAMEQKEIPPMRRFYLSGPMRGYVKFNFPAFDAAATEGRRRGFGVMSPADMDRELGHTEDDTLDSINTPENQRRFAGRDCAALLALKAENRDGIALLPGWEKSTGALAELTLARWLGLCVVDAETWEPITPERLNAMDLSPVVENIRRYMGDGRAGRYSERYSGE